MQINDSVTIYFLYNSTVWQEKWAERNVMKCKVLHLRRNNPSHKCVLETLLCPVTEPWCRVPSEAVEFPSLEALKSCLGSDLDNQHLVALPDLVTSRAPCQSQPFCDNSPDIKLGKHELKTDLFCQ